MRNLTITLALTAILLAAACEIDLRPFYNQQTAVAQSIQNDPWRRTKDGWERTSSWNIRGKPIAARIHPGLVAGMQLLLCIGGLVVTDETQSELPPDVIQL